MRKGLIHHHNTIAHPCLLDGGCLYQNIKRFQFVTLHFQFGVLCFLFFSCHCSLTLAKVFLVALLLLLLLPNSYAHIVSRLPGSQLVVLCLALKICVGKVLVELYSPQAMSDFFPDLLGIWAEEFKRVPTCSGIHVLT